TRARLQPRPHHRAWQADRGRARCCRHRGVSGASPPHAATRDPMSEAAQLRVEHLEVRYGDLVGVADVSLRVPSGSVVALLGSNGAGKTTTLNAIAGLVAPSAGTIDWNGEAIA